MSSVLGASVEAGDGDVIVESSWFGLIEMFVVLMFALAWGALELYTLRLDKRRAEQAKRAAPGERPLDGQ